MYKYINVKERRLSSITYGVHNIIFKKKEDCLIEIFKNKNKKNITFLCG